MTVQELLDLVKDLKDAENHRAADYLVANVRLADACAESLPGLVARLSTADAENVLLKQSESLAAALITKLQLENIGLQAELNAYRVTTSVTSDSLKIISLAISDLQAVIQYLWNMLVDSIGFTSARNAVTTEQYNVIYTALTRH